MAEFVASGIILAAAPSIAGRLATEPGMADLEKMTVISAKASNRVVVGLIGGAKSSVGEIVRAARAWDANISRDQLARLAVNSPEFYCAVGAVATPAPSAPPHVIAAQAHGAHRECPTLWYVNFPHVMSAHDAAVVKHSRQSMLDFRSWSSKKWWEEVNRRYGIADEAVQRARQSREFAQIACEDMVKMSWLRTTRAPDTMHYRIECAPGELHRRIVERVAEGFATVDDELAANLEPIFEGIKTAASVDTTDYSRTSNVVMEKYVYEPDTQSVTSYIRLLTFDLHESWRTVVHETKHDSWRETRVEADLGLCLYEAVFEAAVWDKFSATLHDDETDLLWEYVKGQTLEVSNRL